MYVCVCFGARIMQSVYRLTTDRRVLCRIPVGLRFSTPVQTGPAAYTASSSCTEFLSRDKAAPSGAEVKESVELYLCSPSVPSSQFVGWNLRLYTHTYMFICICVSLFVCVQPTNIGIIKIMFAILVEDITNIALWNVGILSYEFPRYYCEYQTN
jgi:hypothetical protein